MYQIIWAANYAIIKHQGSTTLNSLLEGAGKIYGDQRFEDIDFVIADVSEADFSRVKEQEIEILSAVDSASKSFKPNLKLAFVAGNDTNHKICENYILHSLTKFNSSWEYAIFKNQQEAHDWCEMV